MNDILIRFSEPKAELWYELGEAQSAFESALESLAGDDAVRRIWARDGTLWSEAPVTVADIEDRLGWLDLPETMRLHVARLKALAEEVRAARLDHAVLLGMGGSSLAPEVLDETLVRLNGVDFAVLDSTDPAQILHLRQRIPLTHTLFLVSSKSGTTAETMNLYAYFRHLMAAEVGQKNWPHHFVAITDPGTPLERLAEEEGFRAVYANPADVGGRYSALSLVGLVPGALMNIDLDRLLVRGKEMARACKRRELRENPGLVLGAILGGLARSPEQRRNKLTLLTSKELRPFGPWVEQLIAESTGKNKTGIVPVIDEFLPDVTIYGPDRQFVYMRLRDGDNERTDNLAAQLFEAGHPLIVIPLADRYELGAAFFLWEFATAVAGCLLGINPFDQPDVESAKRQARSALQHYEETQSLPDVEPVLQEADLAIYGPDLRVQTAHEYLRSFFGRVRPGYYIALMAYMERSEKHGALLAEIAAWLTQRFHVPTTIGFGPRFLHSTGQLHKGGPEEGVFVQITHEDAEDVEIPEHTYTFGVLKRAQALGDLRALQEKERSVMRLHLGTDVAAGLRQIFDLCVRAWSSNEQKG
ncbi:MAG: hypothetical protein H5T69_04405 [Chloroflexi bacterium]|nr:hypothetical protein [Chloroflexota bacterium]